MAKICNRNSFASYPLSASTIGVIPRATIGFSHPLIGPQGVEKLLQLSISVALRTKTVTPTELSKVISDTTVMPKAVMYPVDVKLIPEH